VGEDLVGVHVGAALVEDHGLGALEVRVLHHEQPVVTWVGEGPQHRVALADEQPPARAQQAGDDPAPAADVGQPAQRAHAGEHQVEPLGAQHVDRRVHLRLHEVDVVAGTGDEAVGLLHRGGREVEPGHLGAEP